MVCSFYNIISRQFTKRLEARRAKGKVALSWGAWLVLSSIVLAVAGIVLGTRLGAFAPAAAAGQGDAFSCCSSHLTLHLSYLAFMAGDAEALLEVARLAVLAAGQCEASTPCFHATAAFANGQTKKNLYVCWLQLTKGPSA